MEEMIRKQQEEEMVPLNEIKVVFPGDGEAGKSHIIARLLSDGERAGAFRDASSPGIIIEEKTISSVIGM